MATDPVQDVTFGTALKISLDNYYDLLKQNLGNFTINQYLQLKLVADTIDVSSQKYPWYSYWNLLNRIDQSIAPTPMAGVLGAAAAPLADVYERFIRQLRTYVVLANLSPAEIQQVAQLDTDMDGVRAEITKWYMLDRTNWKQYADAMGYDVADENAYFQWKATNGHGQNIQTATSTLNTLLYQQRTILNRKYPEPTDAEVVQAEADFYSAGMRIRYPENPDFRYPNGNNFTLTYLANLPLGTDALFDDRRVVNWNEDLGTMESLVQGALQASFSKQTSTSTSIATDWNSSVSASYAFVSVNASASETTQIQNDFSHGTQIDISSASAFLAEAKFAGWFKPLLFSHKRVVDNIHDFAEFFGPKGSLLYIPTHLAIVRGFKVVFTSDQNWTYDYKRKFSASGGGGFNVFGIGFGAKGGYTNEQKEHTVDVSGTKLSITDDEKTLRFVGYALKKITVFEDTVKQTMVKNFGKDIVDKLNKHNH